MTSYKAKNHPDSSQGQSFHRKIAVDENDNDDNDDDARQVSPNAYPLKAKLNSQLHHK